MTGREVSRAGRQSAFATGGWADDDGTEAGVIAITNRGRLVKANGKVSGGVGGGVSCVSSSTCYAAAGRRVSTLDNGVPENQNEPEFPPERQPLYVPAIACAVATCWTTGPAADHHGRPQDESVFVTITHGVPASSLVVDTALLWPSITRRGDGFAAVGAAVNAGYRVTEFVTVAGQARCFAR